jgi:HAD superfamily hydrolase (TIGR01484 family)
MQTKPLFKGISTALITPFQNGRVDYAALAHLVEYQLEGGVHSIVFCGTTGESATLSSAEKQAVFAFAKEEFDAWLTFNGSYCYDREGEIFSNPVDVEDIKKVAENAAKLGRPIAVATKERMAANGWDQDLEDYYGFTEIPLEVAPDFEEVCRSGVYQVMMGCREAEHPELIRGTSHAKIVAWWDRAADVIPADGGKGLGISKVLAHYGLAKEEALAFGDGNNDIDMLLAVGTGVAMENGSDHLKAIATEVCPPVSEDGIYQYCLAKSLI